MRVVAEDPVEGRVTLHVRSLQVILQDPDHPERLAEVQVAQVGAGLVIIAAGSVMMDRDTRGFARVRVDPE
jgi:hypothetical protein